jgi:hypothetical protein
MHFPGNDALFPLYLAAFACPVAGRWTAMPKVIDL